MNFNKTTEYALQILSFMSKDENKLYSVDEIHNALDIPYRYLKKQMTILTKSELIKSIQGRRGGYKFGKKINDIYLYDIVSVTENNILKNVCFFGYEECNMKEPCIMHDKWAKIRTSILNVLKKTSLKDLSSDKSRLNINKIIN